MVELVGLRIAAFAVALMSLAHPAAAQEWSSYLGKPPATLHEGIEDTIGSCTKNDHVRYSLPVAPFEPNIREGSALYRPFAGNWVDGRKRDYYAILQDQCGTGKDIDLVATHAASGIYQLEVWRHGCKSKCDFTPTAAESQFIANALAGQAFVIYPLEDRDFQKVKETKAQSFSGRFAPMTSNVADDYIFLDREQAAGKRYMLFTKSGSRITATQILEQKIGWISPEYKRIVAKQTFVDTDLQEQALDRYWVEVMKEAAAANAEAARNKANEAEKQELQNTFR